MSMMGKPSSCAAAIGLSYLSLVSAVGFAGCLEGWVAAWRLRAVLKASCMSYTAMVYKS